jgi:hypothetical protein
MAIVPRDFFVMEDHRITAEQLVAELQGDLKVLAEKMAAAINNARPGRIIPDSEEPVRDAHAVFRQQAYQKAIDLLIKRLAQEDFSPSAQPAGGPLEEQGQTADLARHRKRRGRSG